MFGKRLLRCSFCGKDETQVSKLVAGPHVYICDACVTLARRIMDESDDATRCAPLASVVADGAPHVSGPGHAN